MFSDPFLLQPRGAEALTGGAEGPEGSYLCIAFFVLGIAWLGWTRSRRTLARR